MILHDDDEATKKKICMGQQKRKCLILYAIFSSCGENMLVIMGLRVDGIEAILRKIRNKLSLKA